jgi:DNA-binding transcriptional ArsR family regulator
MLMEFKTLDPLLHVPVRLAVISILVQESEADFNRLKERTAATAGNLSVQLTRLREAGYIEIQKQFKDNYPLTLCRITAKGQQAFQEYREALQSYMPAR